MICNITSTLGGGSCHVTMGQNIFLPNHPPGLVDTPLRNVAFLV